MEMLWKASGIDEKLQWSCLECYASCSGLTNIIYLLIVHLPQHLLKNQFQIKNPPHSIRLRKRIKTLPILAFICNGAGGDVGWVLLL